MTDERATTMTDDAISEAKTAIEQAVGCPRECTTYGTGCYCDIAARASLEAALPLIVAKERERAARIAEREVAAMRAAQMEFGGVGSGNPAAVYCQTRGQVAMEIAATIRSGNGGE
jgi:hypothetical protein